MPATDFTKLSLKQRRYVEEVAKGKTRHQALIAAGYSPTNRPCRVENSSIKAAFARLMKQAVPAHKLVQIIAEGCEAQETKFFQKDGKITDQIDVVAWSERREYAKLAAQYGEYASETKDPNAGVNLEVKVVVEHIGRAFNPASA